MTGLGYDRIAADYIRPTVEAFAGQVKGKLTEAEDYGRHRFIVDLPLPLTPGWNGTIDVIINPPGWPRPVICISTWTPYDQSYLPLSHDARLKPIEIPVMEQFDLGKLVDGLNAAKESVCQIPTFNPKNLLSLFGLP
ncbi:hypothetical protein HYY73_03195 [Candidatus Woesearchaeota archaeon]|nr:hypothetical protein [Candidatus Woesearchaeota archaeon]